jgi:hypothetical protein
MLRSGGLIALNMVSRMAEGQVFLRTVLPSLVVVILCAVALAILLGIFLAVWLYAVYLWLLQEGLDAMAATLTVGGIVLAALFISGILAFFFIHKIRGRGASLLAAPRRIIQAFVDGFKYPRKK